MNYTTKHITADKIIGSEKTQLIQEGEILLTDGKPDIDVILKCEARIIPEESSAEENRLSFRAKLLVNVLYCGKDKSVHSISSEAPINDFINIENADSGMLTEITPAISNVECRKINDRKTGYKIMFEINGTVTEIAEIDAITKIDDIPKEQQHFKNVNISKTLCLSRENFTVNEDISLPATKLPIAEILSVNCNITNAEFKPGEDSVDTSGDISIVVLYTSTEGGFPELYEFDMPFNVSLEAENTDTDSIIDVTPYIKDCFYSVSEDEKGEPTIINMEVNIGADIHTSAAENYEILDDAYMPGNEINFDSSNLCYSNIVCRNRGQCPVKEIITLDEKCPDMLQIFRATGAVYIDDISIYENKIVVEGAINIDIMYITGNDDMPIAGHSDTLPFTQTIDARGAAEGMDAKVNANIAHIGFNMLSDRELEVRCALNTNTTVRNKCCIDLITDAEISPIPPDVIDKIPSIVLYIVRKGDTLWKLSKRFNTTVKNIAELNNIENPDLIYPNQKLVIVKGIQ
ncbi:MAG: DUF3794 domain-containing protein [Clostridia bacterium]|nr:DUF3794 domain-containing protein [Clostridia bacterium]